MSQVPAPSLPSDAMRGGAAAAAPLAAKLIDARARWLLFAAAYALLISYGGLFPLSGWQVPADPFAWIWRGAPGSSSRADNLANLLAYMPLGLALTFGFGARPLALLAATLCGGALSFFVETVQMALPTRVASISDLLTDLAGTAAGAALAAVVAQGMATKRVQHWARAFRAAPTTRVGLLACLLWALAQTFPFVPSLDISNLRGGLAPVYHTLIGTRPFDAVVVLTYLLSSAAIAVVAFDLMHRSGLRITGVAAFIGLVILLKVPVVGRQLSLEAIIGVGAVCLSLPLLLRLPRRLRLGLSMAFVVALLVVTQTAAEGGPTRPFNWLPFRAHLTQPLIGMVVMLEAAWPVAAIAYALRQSFAAWQAPIAAWLGGILVVCLVFALEYAQQYIPGRIGDLTGPAIAAVVWIVAWRLMRESQVPVSVPAPPPAPAPTRVAAG